MDSAIHAKVSVSGLDARGLYTQQSREAAALGDTLKDLADGTGARQAAIDFVDAALAGSRQTLLAVAAISDTFVLAQSFTSNSDRLKEALRRLKVDVAAAAAPQVATGASPVATSARELMLVTGNLARNLGALPGRKALVLFAGDALLAGAQSSDVSALAPEFNRSNVAFYPIDSHTAPVDAQASGAARYPATRRHLRCNPATTFPDDNGLNALATTTGGFAAPASNDVRA